MEEVVINQELYKTVSEQLKRHEGLRLKPYRCTAGKLTCGYGRNLESNGITLSEAEKMLNTDITVVMLDMIDLFDDFTHLPLSIQAVLCNMRYQLGHDGIRNFKKMLQAVRNKDFNEMARQMKESSWYKQTPNRAKELIAIVEKEV